MSSKSGLRRYGQGEELWRTASTIVRRTSGLSRSYLWCEMRQASKKKGTSVNWSHFVTSSGRHRGAVYRPWAFTEHGALMAANVLRSAQATQMSLYVIRASVRVREEAMANAAILKRLAEIDRSLLQHDAALRDVYRRLQSLLVAPPDAPKRRIGF
jgi:hypothetical protein